MKLGVLLFVLVATPIVSALDYERDIMPIFVAKCAECHSAEKGKVKGGLRIDDPEHLANRLTKNNLVVPGDWDASYLFITVFRPEDSEDAMPPKGKGERLHVGEVKKVMEWINEGAPIAGERGEKGPPIPDDESLFAHLPPDPDDAGVEGVAMAERLQPVERDWVNREGKTIRATLTGVEDGKAILRLPGGRSYHYPVEDLSDESAAWLKDNGWLE